MKLLGLIAATIVGFLLGGPIAVLAIGALAYGHYRKSNRTNSTSKPGNENDKSNNEKNKEESKKQSTQPPGLGKKALYRAGAIAAGFMLGGPIGAVIAGIFVAIDIMSNGKVIQGVEKLLDASYGALSWLGKKALGIGKWAVDKIRSSGQGQKAGRDAAGEEREKGKEQVAERGVAGKGRGENNLPAGFDNLNYSPETAVEAKNPSAGSVKAGGTVQRSSPNGQEVDGSTPISPEIQRQSALAAASLVQATKPKGSVEQENLRQPSTGGPSTSNQPVPPKTQGQAAQPAKPEDGVKAEGTNPKRPVVGPATGGLAQESPGKGFERGSSN